MGRPTQEKEGTFRLICGRNGIAALMGLLSDKDQRDDPRRLRAKRIIPDPSMNIIHEGSGTLATRKPTPLFELAGPMTLPWTSAKGCAGAGVATKGRRVEERRSLSELPQLPPRIMRPSDDTLFTPSKALSCHSITFPLCPLVPYGLRPPD